MKFTQDNGSLVIDGHDWMEILRFPYYTVAKIREMKVGDELSIFNFIGPSGFTKGSNADRGEVGARIQRLHGKEWKLEVFWMVHIGKAFKRGHIWSWVTFRLGAGSIIRITNKSSEHVNTLIDAEKSVRRVCRLVHRLSKMAKKNGDSRSMSRMMAHPRQYYELPNEKPYIAFLETIAAPPFGSKK